MSNLTRDTVLQRVPDLKVQIDSKNEIKIYTEDKVIQCGPHGLMILDAFYQPTSIEEVLAKLQIWIKGAQDWMGLTTTIVHLYESAVLRDESQNKPTLRADSTGYDSGPIHVAMLNDRARTSSLIKGIQEVVNPGDIVVDIGTGTGILAIAAARAGARHVYAIEASGIGKSARAVFEVNRLADQITLKEGWSTRINLPELGDVLVSDIIGSEPLAENVLEITADAIKRLLKPNARLIPNKIKIFALPVTIPSAELMKHTFIAETLENWKSWYGIDFSPLAEVAKNSPHTFSIKPFLARNWISLSEPVLLAEVDFRDIRQLVIDNTTTVTANASGPLDGILEYFEMELGPTTRYSTHPKLVNKDCVRHNPVWVFTDSLILRSGDKFTVTYQYRKTENRIRVSISRI